MINNTYITESYEYMKTSFSDNWILYILGVAIIILFIYNKLKKKKPIQRVNPQIHPSVLSNDDKIEQWQTNTFNTQIRMIKETGKAMTIKYHMKKQELIKVQNDLKQIEDNLRMLKQKHQMVEKQIELFNSIKL